jgi:AbiV family abortive infection protein
MDRVSQRTIRPIPPPDDLLKLALAAFTNAKDLLVAAQQLADAGSFPPAHALATLAAEETAKSQMCLMVIPLLPFIENPADPESSAAFWDEFNEHKRKLVRVQAFERFALRPLPGSVAKLIRSLPHIAAAAHDRRLRGLFVDYQDEGGVLLLPTEIGEPEAREFIGEVRRYLDFAERTLARVAELPDGGHELIAVLTGNRQLQGLLGEAIRMLHAADPAIALPVLVQWLGAVSGDPPTDMDAIFASVRQLLQELPVAPAGP